MRERLLELIVCPACASSLSLRAGKSAAGDISEGLLSCSCGEQYPVVRGIPRLYRGALMEHGAGIGGSSARQETRSGRVDVDRTRSSFGYQWTQFAEMTDEFEKNFLNYVAPVQPEFFAGKLGLDAGCGIGRHMYYAASYGAEVVGVDYSAAIESSYRNAAHLPRTHFVQADIYHLPFRAATFDFAYSLGVLHHLPDPLSGYRALHTVVANGGTLLVWVYSKRRKRLNAALEAVRTVSHRLPYPFLKQVCFAAAIVDWGMFIGPYRLLKKSPRARALLRPFVPDRVELYSHYPFRVTYTDWFDRLAPPIRFYYDPDDLQVWAQIAGLADARIEPTGKYGYRLQGIVQHPIGKAVRQSAPQLTA